MAATRSSSSTSVSSGSSVVGEGETWKYLGKQHWQPDRIPESDATFLNHKKQERAKDPREALKEQLEYQRKLKERIRAWIKKPFKARGASKVNVAEGGAAVVSEEKLVTEKVAARKKFVVAHFSHSHRVKDFHFPSEFAFVEFSVFNGLGRGIQGFVDTGEILEGFRYEVRDQCKYLSNPIPPFDPDFNADRDALRLIKDFLALHFEENETAIIFALKEYIPVVRDGLRWLLEAVGRDYDNNSDGSAASRIRDIKFEVFPFSSLIVELMNESQTSEYRADIDDAKKYHVDHECLIEDDLRYTKFSYYSDLACEYHMKPENMEGVPRCCETLVKSYVFNALGLVKPFFKVEEKPNVHYPDLKLMARKINTKKYKETSITSGPSVEGGITRFTSSERMSDFISNFTGSDLSGSALSVEQLASEGSRTPVGESQQQSWLDSASNVAYPRMAATKQLGKKFTMPINKPVKKDKFKVDPEVRYAYNLEDYQNKTTKSGEADKRPSYEEAVLNKVTDADSTSYTLGPTNACYQPQPDRFYRS